MPSRFPRLTFAPSAARPSRARTAALALALAAQALAPRAARAQAAPSAAQAGPSAPSLEARAEQKFREGRLAQDKGLFREALALFEESTRLKPSPGTLLNLGNCHLQLGELAKAMAAFHSALDEAGNWQGSAQLRELWEREARAHIEDLSRRIAQLALQPSPTPGARLRINGSPIEHLGEPLLLDPGRYVIELTADGKRPFSQQVELSSGQKMKIDLPPLADIQQPMPPRIEAPPSRIEAPVEASPPKAASHARVLPWALIGGGATLAAGSLIPGLMSHSKAGDLDEACPTHENCDARLSSERDSAATLSLVSDVFWITGALAAGVGVTLLVLDHEDAGSAALATSWRAGCSAAGCGLSAQGHF